EQQEVGLGRERQGQSCALALAARARGRSHVGVELVTVQVLRQASLETPALALIEQQGAARETLGAGLSARQQAFAQRARRGQLRLLLHQRDAQSIARLPL